MEHTADWALDELRREIKLCIKAARLWGTNTGRGGAAALRAVRLFNCYRALRAAH